MSKFGRRGWQNPPEGFDYLEPTLTALDNELRDVNNRSHEGLTKLQSQWPVFQINWQRTRYIYDMYYTYQQIDRKLYDYCVVQKLVDASLAAKWKKNGYERLCSTYVINPRNYKFGTVSMCRVPRQFLADGQVVEDPTTGCRGCASGKGGQKNIFGNKYGQYLAAIQIAREEREEQKQQQEQDQEGGGEEEEEEEGEEGREGVQDQDHDHDHDLGPVAFADGRQEDVHGMASIWARGREEEMEMEMYSSKDGLLGKEGGEADSEARRALTGARDRGEGSSSSSSSSKRARRDEK